MGVASSCSSAPDTVNSFRFASSSKRRASARLIEMGDIDSAHKNFIGFYN